MQTQETKKRIKINKEKAEDIHLKVINRISKVAGWKTKN